MSKGKETLLSEMLSENPTAALILEDAVYQMTFRYPALKWVTRENFPEEVWKEIKEETKTLILSKMAKVVEVPLPIQRAIHYHKKQNYYVGKDHKHLELFNSLWDQIKYEDSTFEFTFESKSYKCHIMPYPGLVFKISIK